MTLLQSTDWKKCRWMTKRKKKKIYRRKYEVLIYSLLRNDNEWWPNPGTGLIVKTYFRGPCQQTSNTGLSNLYNSSNKDTICQWYCISEGFISLFKINYINKVILCFSAKSRQENIENQKLSPWKIEQDRKRQFLSKERWHTRLLGLDNSTDYQECFCLL